MRRAYDAMNRGDWDAALENAHPDVTWTTAPQVPNAGTYEGRDAMRDFLEDQREPFDSFTLEVDESFAKDDQVLLFLNVRARPKGASKEVEVEIAHLWTFRDGKAAAGQSFPDRRDAVEAARIEI